MLRLSLLLLCLTAVAANPNPADSTALKNVPGNLETSLINFNLLYMATNIPPLLRSIDELLNEKPDFTRFPGASALWQEIIDVTGRWKQHAFQSYQQILEFIGVFRKTEEALKDMDEYIKRHPDVSINYIFNHHFSKTISNIKEMVTKLSSLQIAIADGDGNQHALALHGKFLKLEQTFGDPAIVEQSDMIRNKNLEKDKLFAALSKYRIESMNAIGEYDKQIISLQSQITTLTHNIDFWLRETERQNSISSNCSFEIQALITQEPDLKANHQAILTQMIDNLTSNYNAEKEQLEYSELEEISKIDEACEERKHQIDEEIQEQEKCYPNDLRGWLDESYAKISYVVRSMASAITNLRGRKDSEEDSCEQKKNDRKTHFMQEKERKNQNYQTVLQKLRETDPTLAATNLKKHAELNKATAEEQILKYGKWIGEAKGSKTTCEGEIKRLQNEKNQFQTAADGEIAHKEKIILDLNNNITALEALHMQDLKDRGMSTISQFQEANKKLQTFTTFQNDFKLDILRSNTITQLFSKKVDEMFDQISQTINELPKKVQLNSSNPSNEDAVSWVQERDECLAVPFKKRGVNGRSCNAALQFSACVDWAKYVQDAWKDYCADLLNTKITQVLKDSALTTIEQFLRSIDTSHLKLTSDDRSRFIWVPWANVIPPKALFAKDDYLVGKALYDQQSFIGKYSKLTQHQKFYFAYQTREIEIAKNFDILVIAEDAEREWVYGKVADPSELILIDGYAIGRAVSKNTDHHHTPGYIDLKKECIYIAYGGYEHIENTYETLVIRRKDRTTGFKQLPDREL